MPSLEPTPTNRVMRIPLGHVLPSGASFEDPKNSLECKPLINRWPPTLGILRPFWDQRLNLRPLFVCKHPLAHTHRFTSEKCANLNISKVQGVISAAITRGYASSEVLQPLLVDKENSLVLDRVRPAWQQGVSEWKANLQRGLANTSFVPWSVLVKFYYTHFLSDQDNPLEVRGPNSHLVGLQLLGPVFHAIADACSPQHVRPALGFGHQAWENYVQSRVYSQQISLNPAVISRIMSMEPFSPELNILAGEFKGRFDIESFVYQLSVMTAETVSRSTSSPWRDLYKASEKFWKWYLTGKQIEDDSTYLYHQAVAGTVHTIERACRDLESLGILTHDCLHDDKKLPCLKCIQDEGIDMPHKVLSDDDVPAEETRPDPLRKASDVLGFTPSNDADIQELINQFESLYVKSGLHDRRGRDFVALLDKIETTAVKEYEFQAQQASGLFCPLRSMERIPINSDVSAHFGVETFRLPSLSECKDPALFSEYMDKLDEHSEVAHKLELTMCAASLAHLRATGELNESRGRRIDELINTLHHERDDT
jgi:hypothetical protein